MSNPKPTLGYPSRTAAIHALRAQGLSTRQIAEAIGIPTQRVSALELNGGGERRLREEPPSEQLGRVVTVSIDVLDALSPHAARRGMHVNSLARKIITTVVRENMIDAVLDDGGGQ